MIPLKRIDLLISALGTVRSDEEIEWRHFGDGILKNDLEALASERLKLSVGISYRFMGHYPNDELLKYYSRNHVDLFINTSLTEGIPVSIMEAQCFGIPVIATDTGGVKEVVTYGTGSLLPVDFNPGDLATLIENYLKLTEEETEVIRMNCIKNWDSNFSALSNYNNFILKVNSIFESAMKGINRF
jgi:glycosyltransferase involved in cell wall biosynthesis